MPGGLGRFHTPPCLVASAGSTPATGRAAAPAASLQQPASSTPPPPPRSPRLPGRMAAATIAATPPLSGGAALATRTCRPGPGAAAPLRAGGRAGARSTRRWRRSRKRRRPRPRPCGARALRPRHEPAAGPAGADLRPLGDEGAPRHRRLRQRHPLAQQGRRRPAPPPLTHTQTPRPGPGARAQPSPCCVRRRPASRWPSSSAARS